MKIEQNNFAFAGAELSDNAATNSATSSNYYM